MKWVKSRRLGAVVTVVLAAVLALVAVSVAGGGSRVERFARAYRLRDGAKEYDLRPDICPWWVDNRLVLPAGLLPVGQYAKLSADGVDLGVAQVDSAGGLDMRLTARPAGTKPVELRVKPTPWEAETWVRFPVYPGNTVEEQPALVFNWEGRLYLVWRSRRATSPLDPHVYVAEVGPTLDTVVGEARRLSDASTENREPALVAGPSGTLYVAWTGKDAGGDEEIYIAQVDSACRVLKGPVKLTDNATADNRPVLRFGGGNVYVAWSGQGAARPEIFLARLTPDLVLSRGPVQVSVGCSGPSAVEPALCLTPDGSVYVAWSPWKGKTNNMFVSRLNADLETVVPPVEQIVPPKAENDVARDLVLASTTGGSVFLSWLSGYPSSGSVTGEARLQRVGPDCRLLGTMLSAHAGAATAAWLSATPGGEMVWGWVFYYEPDSRRYPVVAVVDASGNLKAGPASAVTATLGCAVLQRPGVAAFPVGGGACVAWVETTVSGTGGDWEVYMAGVDDQCALQTGNGSPVLYSGSSGFGVLRATGLGGAPVAAWRGRTVNRSSRGGDWVYCFARFDATSSLVERMKDSVLVTGGGTTLYNTTAALGANRLTGDLYLLYNEDYPAGKNLYGAYVSGSSGKMLHQKMLQGFYGSVYEVSCSAAPDGTLYVACAATVSYLTDRVVVGRINPELSAVVSFRAVENTTKGHREPSILAVEGGAYLVFVQSGKLRGVKLDAQCNPGAVYDLTGVVTAAKPALARGPSGGPVYLAWQQRVGSYDVVHVGRLVEDSGGVLSLSPGVVLPQGGATEHNRAPHLAVRPDGSVVVAWLRASGSDWHVWSARLDSGLKVVRAERRETSLRGVTDNAPQVVADGLGRAWLFFLTPDTASGLCRCAYTVLLD